MSVCESSQESTGRPCPARASWIAAGSRKSGGQAACGIHLSRACGTLLHHEDRPAAVLSVRKAGRSR